LNLWSRRRLGPNPDGGSGGDIVSFWSGSYGVLLLVSRLYVLSSLVSKWLCILFPWVFELSGRFKFEGVLFVSVLSSPAATLGLSVTVFMVVVSVCFPGPGGRRPLPVVYVSFVAVCIVHLSCLQILF